MTELLSLNRRAFIGGGAALAAAAGLQPAWAKRVSHGVATKSTGTLSGTDIRLTVAETSFPVDGRTGHAIAINGTIPAPLIRLREGQKVRLSHSGLQEQMGHYGPIVIDPAGPDPVQYDREHVIVLSDWTFMHPHTVFTRLKQEGGFFNRNKRTLSNKGADKVSPADAAMFAKMRMDPTDISDVTAATYTYLINGHGPRENWTGLFRPGERVRLRLINAAAQTIFNIRIPGLKLMVVATDGIEVRPVEVDELQIGNAETYDLIVVPEDRAYTFVAEGIDRSGMGVATLAPRAGMRAEVPGLRPRPTLTMADMGMAGMGMGGMDHSAHGGGASAAPMDHDMRDKSKVDFKVGPGVDMIAPMPVNRNDHPGIGLDDVGHRVLTHNDLVSLKPNSDTRVPTRRIDIHLTGNMERFMWSMDGKKLSENPEPYRFARNERVRLRLINDSMMTHPMHLHGHFFEIVNGNPGHQPLKHTVRVLPGAFVDLDLTADAPGDWAFHCHMLYHMHAGMMRVVTVRPLEGGAA
ncbi:copper resistance system multicopper oxidase [Sphingomonas lutea]|uniref:Copper resistance system multicopper oxidase n=1 Tax=Sphingomonas lutea TaxID=1045317 RepID=A0A7G9SEZ9_9SPHN|nr:copper resistance system multicopper oxidase [Sphingomonas lutea]QNN66424.1 copper resistance system multicopper oxidase [Sphingomonas lutea]